PVQGGASPSYQWKLNNVNAGANQATYTNSSLSEGDVVQCVLTSSATCADHQVVSSNSITISVSTAVQPSVSIAASPGHSVCAGTQVTFTATPVNGGDLPSFAWKRNGMATGTNSSTYIASSLSSGDTITCTLTSSNACASPATVTSSEI